MRHRLLFICRHRHHYWGHHGSLSSGLLNSCAFVVDMLNGLGIEAKLVEVVDNNGIDREVHLYRPSHVIVEALWVVPEKFAILRRLHPLVRWAVRLHSKAPFLAGEGIAIDWIIDYLRRGIEVQCNNLSAMHEIRAVARSAGVSEHHVTFLPNYYPMPGADSAVLVPRLPDNWINIGCFGAIRPLKNHLTQAVAAVAFGDEAQRPIRFHINAQRVEGNAEPILRNLRSLFQNSPRHRLIEHPWMAHDAFLEVMRGMDLAMQVSLSETFNIVAADAVKCAVPVVASREVDWLGDYALADPVDARSITEALWRAWEVPSDRRLFAQRRDLTAFSSASEEAWLQRFG